MTEKTVCRSMAKICIKVKTAVFALQTFVDKCKRLCSYGRLRKGCVTFHLCDTQFQRMVSLWTATFHVSSEMTREHSSMSVTVLSSTHFKHGGTHKLRWPSAGQTSFYTHSAQLISEPGRCLLNWSSWNCRINHFPGIFFSRAREKALRTQTPQIPKTNFQAITATVGTTRVAVAARCGCSPAQLKPFIELRRIKRATSRGSRTR